MLLLMKIMLAIFKNLQEVLSHKYFDRLDLERAYKN